MSDLVKGFPEGWIETETGDRRPTQLLSGDCAASINQYFGERLRFNTLSQRVELDEKELPQVFDYLHVIFSQKGWRITEKDTNSALEFIAMANPFDPIDFHLERVKNDPSIAAADINKFSTYYLNNPDPLSDAMWACFFIGAVARTRRKGCKNDTMLILRSDKHGQKKSDLFRTLCFDEKYFCDTPINLKGSGAKDAYQKIGTNWILEIAEVESLTNKVDAGALKALLSSRTDTYRSPFGKHTRKYPRPSVFVGTANERILIKDPTGSRRFHVVEVLEKINIELVQADRDNLWKAAVLAFESGQHWWLTDEQEREAEERNQAYQTENLYLSRVSRWLKQNPSDEVEVIDFFNESYGVKGDPNLWDIGEAGRALAILGYEKKQIRYGDIRKWKWVSPGWTQRKKDKEVTSNSTKNKKVVTPEDPAEEGDPPDLSQVTSNNNETNQRTRKEAVDYWGMFKTKIYKDSLTPRCESEKEPKSVVTSPQTKAAARDIPSQVKRDIGQDPEWDMWKVEPKIDVGIK